MKPIHHLLITSVKYALIFVVVFVIHEHIEKWLMMHYYEQHGMRSHLINLIAIFFVYLVIGYIVYCLFDVVC